MSQLAFGSSPGLGAGDACGRCFKVTANADPFSPGFTGPFKTIVLKADNLCPASGNEQWCGQTTSQLNNSFGMSVQCVAILLPPCCLSSQLARSTKFRRSFDLCQDTGTADAFFPSGHGALTGTYEEVSCDQWSGTDVPDLWNGACLTGESAANWPAVGCGNQGTELSLPTLRKVLVHV